MTRLAAGRRSHPQPRRGGRRLQLARGALAAAGALAASAAAAPPADAHFYYVTIAGARLSYLRYAGLNTFPPDNQISIAYKSDSTGRYFVISDPKSTGITNAAPCVPLTPDDLNVRCPADGIGLLVVDAGDGNNTLTVDAPTPARLYAGMGNDTLRAGSGPTELFGGPGNSTLIAGPVAGNVVRGGTGHSRIVTANGFPDQVYWCHARDTLMSDSLDTVTAFCPVVDVQRPGDTIVPVARVVVRRRQRVLAQGGIVVSTAANKPGVIRVSASVAIPGSGRHTLRAVRVAVTTPGSLVRLELRAPKRLLATIRSALARHRRLHAVVTVYFLDSSGRRSTTLKRRLTLVRRLGG